MRSLLVGSADTAVLRFPRCNRTTERNQCINFFRMKVAIYTGKMLWGWFLLQISKPSQVMHQFRTNLWGQILLLPWTIIIHHDYQLRNKDVEWGYCVLDNLLQCKATEKFHLNLTDECTVLFDRNFAAKIIDIECTRVNFLSLFRQNMPWQYNTVQIFSKNPSITITSNELHTVIDKQRGIDSSRFDTISD